MAALLAGSSYATAAQPSPPSPSDAPAGMIEAIARDLRLTPDQARNRLVQQTAAQRTAENLSTAVRDASSGWWFDETTGALAVAVTSDEVAAQARNAGAQPKHVARDRAELRRLDEAVRAVATGVPGVNGWGVDPVANTVVVRINTTTKGAATQRLLDHLAALGPGVQVAETTRSPVPQGGDVHPGDRWYPGLEGNCSVGFPATDTRGGKHFLTAGHCTDNADQPAYAALGGQNRIGTSNVGGGRSVFGREGDMGVVAVTEPGWNLSAAVNTWGSPPVTVTGSAEAVVNQAVCHAGLASYWQCGKVTATNQTIVYPTVTIDGLSFTTACSLAGDSGGAWLAGSAAVGLHSGGYSSCQPGGNPDQSIFQPIGEALRKWGLTLHTGGAGGDTQAPTVPEGLRSTGTTADSVTLAWNAASDNVAVTGYDIHRGDTLAASTRDTSATIRDLAPDTSYTFTVKAKDAAGNVSAASKPVTARTGAGSGARTFRSDADYPIRDYQPVSSPISVTATGTATNPVRVEVTAQHTCIEDLDIDLVSPSGRSYRLHSYGGSVCHPFPGTKQFTAPVNAQPAAGTWTLRISDGGPGDVGALDRWSITV
ncbi:chitinase [Kibdelosporangium phytohabitans]|uniref:Chitinase n=1 Tax=Kibdelosporangium phytohabitans TaxID=860235 RepID=A0A0N7F5S6_9PSEU|nr:chitinase [Kibdelosporangium phytohabitans]